jgi:hypothetical protein
MLHVWRQLSQAAMHSITHLRTLNPYVVSSLEGGKASVHLPRQAAPAVVASVDADEHHGSVSSFAFQVSLPLSWQPATECSAAAGKPARGAQRCLQRARPAALPAMSTPTGGVPASFVLQGTNAHMVFSQSGSSQHAQQADVVAPVASWHRKRFWAQTAAHALLHRCLPEASAFSGTILLQADLGTAAAAYLQQCSTGSTRLLPVTALLEMAAASGALLCDDAAAAAPAVLGAAVGAQLQLVAGQPLLLTCAADARRGAAEVRQDDAAARQQVQQLSYSLGRAGQAQLPAARFDAAKPGASAALASLLRVRMHLAAAIAAASTADLAMPAHSLSGYQLPLALCEAAASLAGGQQVVTSCAALLPRQWAHLVSPAGSRQALTALAGSSPSELHVAVSTGSGSSSTMQIYGLVLADAAVSADSRSDGYAIPWKRMQAGEADARCAGCKHFQAGCCR